MTTVYIVTEGEYSAYGICRVFSTKEQADEWLEKIGVEDRQDYTIEEYDLDDMSLRPCTFIKVILNINTREVYEIRKNIKNENDECKKIKLLEDKLVEDIEYDKKTGRVTKINNYCHNKVLFTIGEINMPKEHYNHSRDVFNNFINLGLLYISREACQKAEKKMIEQVKLENSKL